MRARRVYMIILVLAAGCAHGLTLPEAAGRLDSDARAVLAKAARRLGAPGARPTIAFSERRPCGGGRARQVFRGGVPMRRGPDPRVDLDDATDVTIGLARARGYRLENPPAFTDRFRTFTMARDDSLARMVVRLHGGPRSSLRVDASTSCLPDT